MWTVYLGAISPKDDWLNSGSGESLWESLREEVEAVVWRCRKKEAEGGG
jgi:hypothetical protein